MSFRSGYVALVGRPNVGKSTLLNALVGTKIAATTHKPQTTRKNLLGVIHQDGAQLLMLDTPGYHRAKGPLNKFMVSQAKEAIRDADVVCYLVEARMDAKVTPGNEPLIDMLVRSEKPIVLVINKIDSVKDKKALLFQIQSYQTLFGERLSACVPISAMNKNGLDRLRAAIAELLPEGPSYYEDGQVTDKSEREIAGELIREKVILETFDELPYAVHVEVDSFEDERPKIVRIMATLTVERSTQKPIVIGKGGERIKAIGIRARQELEHFLDSKVFLEMHVKVAEGWTNSARALTQLGYTRDAVQGEEVDPDDLAEATRQAMLDADDDLEETGDPEDADDADDGEELADDEDLEDEDLDDEPEARS